MENVISTVGRHLYSEFRFIFVQVETIVFDVLYNTCDILSCQSYYAIIFFFAADRGRSRKKKRDFFGAMRTRFNRSKFRSKSIDANQHEKYNESNMYGLSPGQARSISADGTRNSSEPSIGKRSVAHCVRLKRARNACKCIITYSYCRHNIISTKCA